MIPIKTPPSSCVPANAVVAEPNDSAYPDETSDMIRKLCRSSRSKKAAIGCPEVRPWTRRRLLRRSRYDAARYAGGFKDMGRPWDMAKGFDRSAPMSEIHVGLLDTFHRAVTRRR